MKNANGTKTITAANIFAKLLPEHAKRVELELRNDRNEPAGRAR